MGYRVRAALDGWVRAESHFETVHFMRFNPWEVGGSTCLSPFQVATGGCISPKKSEGGVVWSIVPFDC